jgi:hypothetical protein
MKYVFKFYRIIVESLGKILAKKVVDNETTELKIKLSKKEYENIRFLIKQAGSGNESEILKEALSFFLLAGVRIKRKNLLAAYNESGSREHGISSPTLDKLAGIETPEKVLKTLKVKPWCMYAGVLYVGSDFLPYEPPDQVV